MSRWVVPQRPSLKAAGDQDTTAARVVKYVPAEIVAPFTIAVSGFATFGFAGDVARWIAAVMIVFFFIITIVYVLQRTPGPASKNAHLLVTPLAFLAWAYPIASTPLGSWFLAPVAFALQVVVLGLSVVIVPRES